MINLKNLFSRKVKVVTKEEEKVKEKEKEQS